MMQGSVQNKWDLQKTKPTPSGNGIGLERRSSGVSAL